MLRDAPRPRRPVLLSVTQEVSILLTACAWCDRVRLGDAWVEAEDAIRRLRTYENDAPPSFTHTICESCFDDLERRHSEKPHE